MSEYDQTFDPNILIGHCDLISRFSDFAFIYRHSIGIFSYFFQIMSEYDQTFNPNILIGHCDLISRFSDFVLYLGSHLVCKHISFTECFCMTRPLTLHTVSDILYQRF